MDLIYSVCALSLLAFIVHAAVWDARRRGDMTPLERDADDAESRREAKIW